LRGFPKLVFVGLSFGVETEFYGIKLGPNFVGETC
jgi:hypothetical protein